MEDIDSKFASISITGMLSWIPQATNSFLEKLSTINGFLKKVRQNIIKRCFHMRNEYTSKVMLMNATLGLPGNVSVIKF